MNMTANSSTYLSASGPLLYNMTNDYMFRIVNQKILMSQKELSVLYFV